MSLPHVRQGVLPTCGPWLRHCAYAHAPGTLNVPQPTFPQRCVVLAPGTQNYPHVGNRESKHCFPEVNREMKLQLRIRFYSWTLPLITFRAFPEFILRNNKQYCCSHHLSLSSSIMTRWSTPLSLQKEKLFPLPPPSCTSNVSWPAVSKSLSISLSPLLPTLYLTSPFNLPADAGGTNEITL